MKTCERLAAVLEQEGLRDLAVKARRGDYDDYRSHLAMPIAQLVNDLCAAKRKDLAERAADGEWDGTKEEAEEWLQAWAKGV